MSSAILLSQAGDSVQVSAQRTRGTWSTPGRLMMLDPRPKSMMLIPEGADILEEQRIIKDIDFFFKAGT